MTLPSETEKEIRDLCRLAVRGKTHDVKRILKLQTLYSEEFSRIAKEEREIARQELNPYDDTTRS